jgi:hypothetical protein
MRMGLAALAREDRMPTSLVRTPPPSASDGDALSGPAGHRSALPWNESNLSVCTGCQHCLMSSGCILQSKLSSDNGCQGLVGKPRVQSRVNAYEIRVCRVPKCHSADDRILLQDGSGVDVGSTSTAHDDDPPEGRYEREISVEVHVGQVLDHNIEPRGRRSPNVVLVSLLGVVEGVSRSVLFHEPQTTLAACGGDDGGAGSYGELERGDAHATARTVDEDSLTTTKASSLEESSVGSGVRYVDRRSLSERNGRWKTGGTCRRIDSELGIRAESKAGAEKIDVVADIAIRDFGTNVANDSRSVVSRNVGIRREFAVVAGANVGIDRIDSDGLDFDQDLVRARSWRRDLLEAHDRGRPGLMYTNRFHLNLSFRMQAMEPIYHMR